MTQTVANQVAETSGAAMPGRRLAALAGVAFSALFFLGTASLNVPVHATDGELVTWWSSSGNRITAAISMYMFAAAALCFLGFLSHLSARIGAAESRAGQLARVTFAAGVFFSAMLAVAAAARGVVGKAVEFNDQPVPGADTLRYLAQLSSAALGVLAMLGAATAIGAVSCAILRTGVFGRWLAWLGIVAAVVLVAAQATFVGEVAIPAVLIWTVAASIAMWRTPSGRTGSGDVV